MVQTGTISFVWLEGCSSIPGEGAPQHRRNLSTRTKNGMRFGPQNVENYFCTAEMK